MKTKIQNKKIYSKPLLEVIAVDYEISMNAASVPDVEPDPFDRAQQNDPVNSGPTNLYKPTSEDDVFGGGSPQY